jgi:hypothetical protein
MDRRAARRVVSIGALLALTVWMGGLPAAVAEEPVPDTPTAAAPAVSDVGDEPVPDVTPTPEPSPSVGPSTPDDQPPPATDPSPAPSVEPSSSAPDTGEEPGQPGSETTTTPSDAPPAVAGDEEPGAQPSPTQVSPSTDPSRAVLEAAVPEGTVTIGDFDCDSLTAQVALDNSLVDTPTDFTVRVYRFDWYKGFLLVSNQHFHLEPHQSQTVTVALLPDALTKVWAQSSLGEVRTQEGTCGSYTYDPRAAIDSLDCANLTGAVRLDNSRSTDTVAFEVSVSAAGGLDPRSSGSTFQLSAGEVRGVEVSLDDYAVDTVTVSRYLWQQGWRELARGETTCGYVSRASIDAFDCGSLTATAHLENGSATVPTIFHVRSISVDERPSGTYPGHTSTLMDDEVEVSPGATTSISIPLGDDTENSVSISGPGGWPLAEDQAVCGQMVITPRAVIGDADCSAPTVPVTLDNSASNVPVTYFVGVNYMYSDQYPGSGVSEHLEAGEVRQLRVPIEEGAFYRATVSTQYGEAIATSTGQCGLLTVSPVDCVAQTVDLTFHNSNAYRLGQVFWVYGTGWPEDRSAFHTDAVVAPGATTLVTVPLRELDDGKILIGQEGGTAWYPSLATVVVDPACSEGVTPGARPGATVTADAGLLAATGAEGLPQLLLGGLLLLTVGGMLLRVGRERRD